MNAQERRRARRRAARQAAALNKGAEPVLATATIEPRELAPDEVLEDASADLPDTVEVSNVLSPERRALALVTEALNVEPESREMSVEISMDTPETVALRLVPAAIEQLIAGVALNGEAIDPDGDMAQTIRLNLEGFTFESGTGFIIADAMEVDLPAEMQPGETLPDRTPSPAAPEGGLVRDESAGLRWTASFAPEGFLTDDGRAIAPGALTWRELPLTLMAMVETTEGGHMGALVSGRIDQIWRDSEGMIRGAGVFDDGEFGLEIARMVDDRTLRGISIDMAIQAAEVGPRADYFDIDGNWAPRDQTEAADEEQTLFDMLFGEEVEEPIFVITDAVIGAVTVCPFPAFANTTIEMAASLVSAAIPACGTVTQQNGFVVVQDHAGAAARVLGEAFEDGFSEAVTASAAGLAPVRPPASWFTDPGLTELTPLTVTEDGRVFGHAWAWDVCHIGIPSVCTTAPRSQTDYALFHLKEVECDDGARVQCGTITLDTGHADKSLGRAAAAAHYDDTGCAVVDVVMYEDEFGGAIAGALRPDVDAEKARELRGAVLSGDWRNVDGNLELVALLAVNVPGFPVPRPRALVAAAENGEMEVLALVAAGIHLDEALMSTADRERIQALRDQAMGRFAELAARATA